MLSTTHPRGPAGVRILELASLLVLPPLLHLAVPIATVVPKPLGYLGGAPMVLGIALMVAARDAMHDAGTRLSLHDGPSVLVTSGPFRWSRNPMYLGMTVWLVGMAVFFGSLVSFVFPLAFFAVASFVLVPMEEVDLEREHGEAFRAYRRATRRWL